MLSVIFIMTNNNIIKATGSVTVSFTAFYEKYLPQIFRYISYRVTDKHLAEDLTSTVFEKALTKFESYRPEKASFSTWVFRIARNTVIDYFRVRGREQTIQLDEAVDRPGDDKSPEQTAIDEEEFRMLNHFILRLAPHEQEIISLKFAGDMTNRQIAGMLGLSESNVGVIVYRAVRKLRSDFEEWRNG